ncbi:PTS transporter subunit EIIC [Paenibacillus sp. HN-1]|uniref:PTS transporter subunit EIIC n=1 Tax=Paenibacillus TaxID=44249 RepID=UPI001CA8231F|nr:MULTISPECIES: PTS transporter subunit EIIC [Paenibacillus]MBY9081832.1 PTS transporter subunit EIIC [Paenibacillus sp. CGMCC 1.18879]MBY9088123.1 PTS transporter subunit EIIC [Paenibacillus sinensis]
MEQGTHERVRDDNEGDAGRVSVRELANQLVELSGGHGNITEITHCTTRVRLRLRRPELADEAELGRIKEVQSAFKQSGQLQIIVGPAMVYKVHRHIVRLLQEPGESPASNPETPQPLQSQQSLQPLPSQKETGIAALLRRSVAAASLLSDIVIPMIPLFVAVGILLGLLSGIRALGVASSGALWFQTLVMLTGAAFQILAVMFGYHAARRFGGTPALGAAIGLIMTRPGLLPIGPAVAPAVSDAMMAGGPQFGYQGTVIPIIVAVLLMSLIEKGLRRIVPSSAATMIVPFLSLVLGGYLAVMFIGPITGHMGALLSGALEEAFRLGGTFFGLILGGVYGFIVLTGLHQGIQAIEAGLISNPAIGVNFLLPIWSMANIAQGGAGLAVYARTLDHSERRITLTASVTAFLGITEPVVFGVNLRRGYPFLGAAAGGASGGAYVAYHQVVANSFGLTGIPMLAFVIPAGQSNLIHYLIGIVIAAGTAFAVTWALGGREFRLPAGISHLGQAKHRRLS